MQVSIPHKYCGVKLKYGHGMEWRRGQYGFYYFDRFFDGLDGDGWGGNGKTVPAREYINMICNRANVFHVYCGIKLKELNRMEWCPAGKSRFSSRNTFAGCFWTGWKGIGMGEEEWVKRYRAESG